MSEDDARRREEKVYRAVEEFGAGEFVAGPGPGVETSSGPHDSSFTATVQPSKRTAADGLAAA